VESTLHRQLKARFGPERGGHSEVVAGGFRADALGADGEWVEIQYGPLGPLRTKLGRLLPERRVRIVKPIIIERRIVRRSSRDGPDVSARKSPRRGDVLDVFDDLVGLARIFPHANLRIDVLEVAVDEIRIPRRRWPGYAVADRGLREVWRTVVLRRAADLWELLPHDVPNPFTTLDLAGRLLRPLHFAQRVAYCLRLSGAAATTGKIGNRLVYTRPIRRERRSRSEMEHDCA
jgi:hypothetical protein